MRNRPVAPAALTPSTPQVIALTGCWTARGLGAHGESLVLPAAAWVRHNLLAGPTDGGAGPSLRGLPPEFASLLASVGEYAVAQAREAMPATAMVPSVWENTGRSVLSLFAQWLAMLRFVGESAHALAQWLLHPSRIRGRAVLFNLGTAGVHALPIVVAGRSGSACAAQIGTMAVTEEIDAMRTLGLVPQELLVLHKVLALVTAKTRLGVDFGEFLDRLVKAVSITS